MPHMAQNKGIRQRAQVTVLAPTDDAPLETPGETTSNSPGSSSSSKPKHDAGLLSRIQKSLALAKHSGTSEAEARQALRLATRLMSTYNVTQADLLVSSSSESDSPSSRGGISTVTITRTDASLDGDGAPKRVLVETWAARAAYAMTIFFDVKAYSTARDTEVVWTFYGIAPNTVAAAMAFETTHNATLTWAMERPEARGRTGKNSYCHGVAAGLVEMAREEKGRELRIAQKMEQRAIRAREQEEKKQRQREVERLQYQEQSEAGPTVKAEPDTSRNADGISAVKPEAEPDSEPTPRIKREPQPVKLEDAPDGASSDDDEFFDAPLDLHRDDDHRDENATPMIDLTLLEDETKVGIPCGPNPFAVLRTDTRFYSQTLTIVRAER